MTDEIKIIADRIRALREINDISIPQICEQIGIEEARYLELETGTVDIPVSILYELAIVHHVALTDILSGDSPKLSVCQMVKNGAGLKVERSKQYSYRSLAYNMKDRKAEPFLVIVEPVEGDEIPQNTHPGQEFDYLLEGEMVISINGKQYNLKPGDSIFYNSAYPHGMRAVGDSPAKFLAIIM